MLSWMAAGNYSQLKKNKHNYVVMPSYQGVLDNDLCTGTVISEQIG